MPSESDILPSETAESPLGELRLEHAVRQPPRERDVGAVARASLLAVATHIAVFVVLDRLGEPDGFVDTGLYETLGVEIVTEATPPPSNDGSEAPDGRDSRAKPAPDTETARTAPMSEQDATPPSPVAETTEAPPDEAPKADKVAEAEAAPRPAFDAFVALTRQAAEPASTPSPTAATETSGIVTTRLPEIQSGGGARDAGDYERLVVEALRNRPPRPLADRRGRVVIAFSIARDGSVSNAYVKSSSGSPDLDLSALATIRVARFPPPPPDMSPRQEFVMPYIFR